MSNLIRYLNAFFLPYLVAFLAAIAATTMKLALGSFSDQEHSPFLLYSSAVLIAAIYGGFRPGLLAVCLAAVFSGFFFHASRQQSFS